VGYLVKYGDSNLDRITNYHNLETDEVEPLTDSRKREMIQSMDSGFKDGVFPVILAYKET
jgi:hypothetical protein